MDQIDPTLATLPDCQKGAVLPYKEYVDSAKRPLLAPAVWSYAESTAAVYASDRDFKRRIVALAHPALRAESAIAPGLSIVMQLMRPGERSQLHRHSPWALHVAIQGKGYTIIDGVRYDWGVGDVVFTPAWAYHEHVNTSDTEDALLYSLQNLPTLATLNALFREEPAGEPMKHVLTQANTFVPPPRNEEEQGRSSWR